MEPLFDSLAGFGRKILRGLVIFALMGGVSQEFQLFTVTAAPFAEKEVDAQAEFFKKRQRTIHAFGLQPACLPATGREQGRDPGESLDRRAGRFYVLRRHLIRCFR